MKRGLVCLMQHSVKTLTCSARAGTQHHAGLVIDPTSQDVSHPSLCLPHHFIFVRQPPVSLPPSSFHLRTSATRLSASLIISSSYVSHPSLCLPHHFIFVRQPPVSLPPSSFHLRTSATRLSASLIISSSHVSHQSLCLPHHFIFVRQPPVSLPPSSFHLRTSATRLSASLIISSSYVSHPSLCLPHHFIFVRQPHVTLQHFILCHHEPRSRFGRRDGNMNLQLDTSILKYLVHPIMIGFRFLFSVVRWFVFHRQYRRPAFCTLKIQTHERLKKWKKITLFISTKLFAHLRSKRMIG